MRSRFPESFFAALAAVVLLLIGRVSRPAFSAGPTFFDVPLDHPYYEYIEALYQNGYVAGCSSDPMLYCPEQVLNRAESAVFVERGVHGAGYLPVQPTEVTFEDVALYQWYAKWIDGLWEDGYSAGCGTDPLVYCPDQDHTRAEGCVFYLRMMYGADYKPPQGPGYFTDVDPSQWYADWVDACREAGIAESCGTGPREFCPEDGLTRAAAAYMMVQARGIPLPAPTPAPTPTPPPSGPYSTFADGLAPSMTLWVSNRGSAGGDGSYENPYASFSQAQHASPGTEIRVEGEISGRNYLTFNGTASAPIWIRGETGARVDGLFLLSDSSYVVVEDLEFTGSHDHQIHLLDSHYILLQRLDIHDPERYCLKVYHGNNIYLFDSSLHDAETNTTWIGTHGGRILNNHMYNAAKNILVLKGGSQDIFVAFNEFENQINSKAGPIQLGNATGAEYFNPLDADYEGLRLIFFANMIHNVTATPINFMGCRDCAAIHNTIFDLNFIQDAPLVRFLPGWVGQDASASESVTDGCRFSGNIIVGGTEGSSTLSTYSHGVGPSNSADYNIFYKPGPVNWHGQITQDLDYSTYDQDPRLDEYGIPRNYSLVNDKGPTNLSGLPFSEFFILDFYRNPFSVPYDIGSAAFGSNPLNR
ncbi:MAG: right-handed parallel beta-helix repeat-containing protein [Anaerolineales bacterium]|nr:right-handed parallel beta-helix repeat-containing protein [Anaerolineales bacterium]